MPKEFGKYENRRYVTTEVAGMGEHSPGQFNTTRWSMVLSCADSGIASVVARDALSELCKTYWRPIFAYICRRGYSTQDAEDLTQDFFTSLLQGPLLQRADRDRGRFRSLLLKALRDFLGHATEKLGAHKRGGGVKLVSWDDWMAEAPSQLSLATNPIASWTAERVFDFRWAATVVEQSLRRLSEECARRGKL